MIEDRVKIHNVLTNYKISGAGEPLLILHGWGGSSESWDNVRQILSKNGFRVISPDFPGFGKSENPNFEWSLNDYIDWTLNFINYAELDNFSVLGHSFGGRVAIKMCAQYPNKVKKLILCDPAGIKIIPSFKTQALLVLSEIGNFILRPEFFKVFRDFFRDILYSFIKKRDYVQASSLMQKVMQKVLKEDLSIFIPQIRQKTLIIWGKEDKIVPVKYAKVFKENIKDSELEIFPLIGHSPHLEAPEKLAERVVKFFK